MEEAGLLLSAIIPEVINGELGFLGFRKNSIFLELRIDFTGYGFAHLAS